LGKSALIYVIAGRIEATILWLEIPNLISIAEVPGIAMVALVNNSGAQ
jgi:hypothetical protein